MAALEEWTRQACAALGLDPAEIDQKLVLDLARDVAHDVMRPAAPLTAYLVGVAVGRGAAPAETIKSMSNAAAAWGAQHPTDAD